MFTVTLDLTVDWTQLTALITGLQPGSPQNHKKFRFKNFMIKIPKSDFEIQLDISASMHGNSISVTYSEY